MRFGTVLLLLVLAVPLTILPWAAHLLVSGELERGKTVGTAYLQAQAESLAALMQTAARPEIPEGATVLPVLAGVTDGNGAAIGQALPRDGRCFGVASLSPRFPGRFVRVAWPGDKPAGLVRRMRLHRVEIGVYVGCAAVYLLAVFLLVRTHLRTKRALADQLALASDFSHRLKTPITSISLCAELAKGGRLSADRKRECSETIIAEAVRLDAIVGEVLAHIEGAGRG